MRGKRLVYDLNKTFNINFKCVLESHRDTLYESIGIYRFRLLCRADGYYFHIYKQPSELIVWGWYSRRDPLKTAKIKQLIHEILHKKWDIQSSLK